MIERQREREEEKKIEQEILKEAYAVEPQKIMI